MLKEFKRVRQVTGYFRRWYSDDYFDLIVWYDEASRITGFQLCYDRNRDEHAFTWRAGKGFSHNRVDDGEADYTVSKMSPILVPDGEFPVATVSARFAERSAQLDPEVRELVLAKLREFSGMSA